MRYRLNERQPLRYAALFHKHEPSFRQKLRQHLPQLHPKGIDLKAMDYLLEEYQFASLCFGDILILCSLGSVPVKCFKYSHHSHFHPLVLPSLCHLRHKMASG